MKDRGTEEVPGTHSAWEYPRWKEYSLLEKAWVMLSNFVPILCWIGFGLLCLKLGES